MEIPTARVLVVGDSGVGKTTLLQRICARDVEAPPTRADSDNWPPHRWTIGCDIHVLLHRDRAGRDTYIEFVDIGGHPKYDISRGMFYREAHGLVFVHDLTNARSFDHLRQWMREIQDAQHIRGDVVASPGFHGSDRSSLQTLPKLILGNKRDQVPTSTRAASSSSSLPPSSSKRSSSSSLPPELRGVSCIDVSATPLSLESYAWDAFLDQVTAFASAQNDPGSGSHFGLHSEMAQRRPSRPTISTSGNSNNNSNTSNSTIAASTNDSAAHSTMIKMW